MQKDPRLEELLQEYERLGLLLIEEVGNSVREEELDQLKRKLETIASQIRKIDVNCKL